MFHPLFIVLFCNCFSCLANLAKPYPVSGRAFLPQVPEQLHYMSNCAHQVLMTLFIGTDVCQVSM